MKSNSPLDSERKVTILMREVRRGRATKKRFHDVYESANAITLATAISFRNHGA
jgi:hypothetical protein